MKERHVYEDIDGISSESDAYIRALRSMEQVTNVLKKDSSQIDQGGMVTAHVSRKLL